MTAYPYCVGQLGSWFSACCAFSAQYGSRMRVEGMAAKFATGLYVPQMSGAKQDVEGAKPDVD